MVLVWLIGDCIHSCMHACTQLLLHLVFIKHVLGTLNDTRELHMTSRASSILPGTSSPHRLPVPLCIKWGGWTESLGFLSFSKINCYFSDSNACSALPGRAATEMKLEHEHESALPSEKHCSEWDALSSLLLPQPPNSQEETLQRPSW